MGGFWSLTLATLPQSTPPPRVVCFEQTNAGAAHKRPSTQFFQPGAIDAIQEISNDIGIRDTSAASDRRKRKVRFKVREKAPLWVTETLAQWEQWSEERSVR